MAGYAARVSPAATVHDPLEAQALALGTPTNALVVVVCDLLAVDERLVEAVRDRVRAQRPGASVWLSATHTHSGPDIGGPLSEHPPDSAIRESIVAGATRAALSATAALRPVRASWASGEVRGVATNRDHPETGEDLTLDLLCLFEAESHASMPIAVFGSFPCHPTVLGATTEMDLAWNCRPLVHATPAELRILPSSSVLGVFWPNTPDHCSPGLGRSRSCHPTWATGVFRSISSHLSQIMPRPLRRRRSPLGVQSSCALDKRPKRAPSRQSSRGWRTPAKRTPRPDPS